MDAYWYCGVKVKGIDTVYSYISDEGEIAAGEYVVVPFGSKNREYIGEVVSCQRCEEDAAPFPVEKTKHIIRIASAEEYENSESPLTAEHDDDFDELSEADYYIENGCWDEVLEWAMLHNDSTDKEIVHKVIQCYELCVKQNIPVAALNLGTFYYNGVFLEQDYKEAFRLYKIAADAGERRAICNCGYCFYYGRHREVDYAEAFRYFSLGALLFNDANCIYKLGDMYARGYGIEKNEKYAYLLYNRALDCCFEWDDDDYCLADAQFRVGKCKLYGIGTEKDVEAAQGMLSRALTNFYRRRGTDPFVSKLISGTRTMLIEAQAILDEECLHT